MGSTDFTDPVAFYQLFREVVADPAHDEQLKSLWRESTEYTAYVTTAIYPALAKKSDLRNHDKTYWTIDCILFDKWDEEHFNKDTQYAKRVYVAIEHENDWRHSATEMNKLQLLNVPLRVLITYPNSDKERDKLIDRYKTIIQTAHELFNETDSTRRTLVIFGYRHPNFIERTAYHYTNGQLQLLTPQTTGQNTPSSVPA